MWIYAHVDGEVFERLPELAQARARLDRYWIVEAERPGMHQAFDKVARLLEPAVALVPFARATPKDRARAHAAYLATLHLAQLVEQAWHAPWVAEPHGELATYDVLDFLEEWQPYISKEDGGLRMVILDGMTQKATNDKYRVMLEAAGAKFEWSDPQFSYMHAKTIIVDDNQAMVSTSNYALSYIMKERNYAALIVDPQDVGDLAALFDRQACRAIPCEH